MAEFAADEGFLGHCRRVTRYASDLARPVAIALFAIHAAGCVDSANVARTDQPAPLLALSDSLEKEHFRGIVVAEALDGGVLQLRFRDAGGCGRSVEPLREFAEHAAARAVALFRPQLMPRPTTVDRVRVQFARTHRFGVVVWTTSLGEFSFPVSELRSVAVPPPAPCGSLSPLLRQHPDSSAKVR